MPNCYQGQWHGINFQKYWKEKEKKKSSFDINKMITAIGSCSVTSTPEFQQWDNQAFTDLDGNGTDLDQTLLTSLAVVMWSCLLEEFDKNNNLQSEVSRAEAVC